MWEIGDRVAVTDLGMVSQENYGIEIKIGYKGTIINFLKVDVPWNPDEIFKFLVEFDEPMDGHDGNDFGKISGNKHESIIKRKRIRNQHRNQKS